MRKKARFFVALNDCKERRQCLQILENNKDVLLVGQAFSGEETFRKIRLCQPDVVILDVVLPGMDCFTMIELLESSMNTTMPQFVICFSIMPEVLIPMTQNRHVIHYLSFPMRYTVLERQIHIVIEHFMNTHQAKVNYIVSQQKVEVVAEESSYDLSQSRVDARIKEQEWERIVARELNNIGALSEYKGYIYLIQAIATILKSGKKIKIMVLYEQVADHYQTKSSSVERAIRTVINQIWNIADKDYLTDLLGTGGVLADRRPSNGNFIYHMANMIQQNYSSLVPLMNTDVVKIV